MPLFMGVPVVLITFRDNPLIFEYGYGVPEHTITIISYFFSAIFLSASFSASITRAAPLAFSSIEAICFLSTSFSSVNRPFSFISCLFCSMMALTLTCSSVLSGVPFASSCPSLSAEQ